VQVWPFTLDDLFAEAGFTPNDAQRQAIGHTNGPLFLVAGPGSGKTRVLLWRTVNLILFHGVPPERIFLSTFTEKAAKQLRDGLLTLLGRVTNRTNRSFDLSKMYVGTVHSLCHRLLADRTFSPGRARAGAPIVMDALEQYFHLASAKFWRGAAEALGHAGPLEDLRAQVNAHFETSSTPSRHKAVVNLQSLFNRLSEEDLDPKPILEVRPRTTRRCSASTSCTASASASTGRPLAAPARRLSALIANDGTMHRFKHVIVDEYQDTNAIQERIFFRLAGGSKNVCVVGDDDQALYRFRGATVENFVRFPERCLAHLGGEPTRIELNINYRSRAPIVELYTHFIEQTDWTRPGPTPIGGTGYFRLHDKGIRAHRPQDGAAVVASTAAHPEQVAAEIAGLVKDLITSGRVADPNQVAFLFPSLKSVAVQRMMDALDGVGLKVYAPRAKRFLEADEPSAMIGLIGMIVGRPPRTADFDRGEYKDFHDWLDACHALAQGLVKADVRLQKFVKDRQAELAGIRRDFAGLAKVVEKAGWSPAGPYDPDVHKRGLVGAPGLSDRARRALSASYLDKATARSRTEGTPFTLRYVVNRATSVDWGLLDVFYHLAGFDHFKAMFDLAETGEDEGPICNLALTSQYISRYVDAFPSVLTASAFEGERMQNGFYHSFLLALFRLGEGEYEDAEDPFPKGRIPFLTVHQSKGLEFPVVVLGNVWPANREVRRVERLVRPYLSGDGEPLDRMGDFDAMRMFYVALSRAQNLVVIAHPKGVGQQVDRAFKPLLQGDIARIPHFDAGTIPPAKPDETELARRYSYTGDFQAYLRCPRQYMLFQKYGFAASRTQTMFFGSLVHQTIEDLHNRLIAVRQGVA
jgi:DNA helicase-2/ATP-dependent DNA helicase PcrA